jgi:hypothetical protein
MKTVAAHLSKDTWDKLQKALFDKKVSEQTVLLEKQFNERLDAKVQELLY